MFLCECVVFMQPAATPPRQNTDIRITTAYNIFEEYPTGQLLIHKTTRAGCTTALGSEALNRNEPVLMIVPTNMIAQKTIVKDMSKYSDVPNPYIIHVKSNHNCLINEELCQEYPDLKKLPILPLPHACEGCASYQKCPITEIIRHPNADGIVLTYSKLVAAMISSGGEKESMGDKILNVITKTRNIVFDEVHEIQYGKTSTLVYYNDARKNKHIATEQYKCLEGEYKELWDLIQRFIMTIGLNSTQATIKELKEGAEQDDFWRQHLSRTIQNRFYDDTHYSSKKIKAIYSEIVKLTMDRKNNNLTMQDIINLYKIMNIVMSKKISIHSIRDKKKITVNISAVDLLYTEMIRSFSMSMQNKGTRTMLTSATICSYDYGNMFIGTTKPKNIMFGKYGDPMNTNDKMTIYPDTKTYTGVGRYSFISKKKEIVDTILEIFNKHGKKNCLVIATNIKFANIFKKELIKAGQKHDVTYYKSPEMMGVTNKARVMIALGVAYKPANAFDVITKDVESSQALKFEAIHADTWQAWSRVKDPSANEDSFVYALGVKEDICRDIVKWGYNRKVTFCNTNNDKQEHSNNSIVEIENNCLSEPKVEKNTCLKTVFQQEDNLSLLKNLVPDFSKKYHYNIYWYFLEKTGEKNLKRQILRVLLNRTDTYAEQNSNGKGYFRVPVEISDKLLDDHIKGNLTIGGYCLNTNNEVANIVFDIDAHPDKSDTSPESLLARQQEAEQDLLKLRSFLDMVKIPYILEASGSPHSYHVWIVLKPVNASTAKEFGKQILRDAGVKCEMFPKQSVIRRNDGYGNLVKLPFGINNRSGVRSMIEVNGVFTEYFEMISIGELDISTFVPEETKTKPPSKQNKKHSVPTITTVRPCIQAALNKQLTGEQGHMMRIAIVREHYNCGITEPEHLVDLFSGQPDFDPDKSLMHINSIISQNYAVWRRATLLEQCGSFIDCNNCNFFQCKERYN